MIVGRAGELAQLGTALGQTRAGRGRLVLIAGAPGIGKSRLADAAAERARRAGMTVARGYAVDEPGAPPLWPWLRLMRGWDDAARLPVAETWEGDAAARFQLFTAITALVCGHATGDGLLLILEDMHWADQTSVRLLRHLVAAIGDEPMAVLVTYRNGVPGPLLDVAPALLSSDLVLPLTLAGLSVRDVADWLPKLTGSADGQLAKTLWERTGGNPLLIRLVAHDLAAHGDSERLMAERPELRRLVAARASELTAETRAVVDAASVLGERIHTALLAEMTGRADLGPALDEAVASGILRDNASPPGLRFEHALVRDAVYAELATSRRADLHRHAAQLLARVGEPNVAGMVVSHWRRASGRDVAGQCQIWAGRADTEARQALAYDDAVRYAELALSCAQQAGGDAERARLLIRLAEAQFLANALEPSVSSCSAAADLADAARRPDLLAQAGLVVHGIGASAYHIIAGICERALAVLPPGEHATRARLHAQLAVGIAEREGGPHAAELAAEALTDAERSGDPQAILEALAARHLAISIPQAVAERLELGRQAVALGRAARHPVAALWGHLWRTDAAIQLGNLAEGRPGAGGNRPGRHRAALRAGALASPPLPRGARRAIWRLRNGLGGRRGRPAARHPDRRHLDDRPVVRVPAEYGRTPGRPRPARARLGRGHPVRAADAAGPGHHPHRARADWAPRRSPGRVRGVPAPAAQLPAGCALVRHAHADRRGRDPAP